MFVKIFDKTIFEIAQEQGNEQIINYLNDVRENLKTIQPKRYEFIQKRVQKEINAIIPENRENIPTTHPELYGTIVAYNLLDDWFRAMKFKSQFEVYKIYRHEMKRPTRIEIENIMRKSRVKD